MPASPRKLTEAQLRVLRVIHQAPPLGVEVIDFWGSGWCRTRVQVPRGADRITATTYEWLRDKGLLQETRYSARPSTTGLARNRRYATLNPAGYAALGKEPTPVQVTTSFVAGRRLAEYTFERGYQGHSHSNENIVGYVVRETVRDGQPLLLESEGGHGPENCGYDVFVVEGAGRYALTFPTRDTYRQGGGYAVVDTLFNCGCRL